MIELVDHRGQAALETDAHLDFAAQPQIVVGDIAEQPADDAGQRDADDVTIAAVCCARFVGLILA